MFAYPSFKDMSEAISSGTLIDCSVTIQSLKRSNDIYCIPEGILKGKTIHTSTTYTAQCLDQQVMTYTSRVISSLSKESLSLSLLPHQSIFWVL